MRAKRELRLRVLNVFPWVESGFNGISYGPWVCCSAEGARWVLRREVNKKVEELKSVEVNLLGDPLSRRAVIKASEE
jgi:hypothetical protein